MADSMFNVYYVLLFSPYIRSIFMSPGELENAQAALLLMQLEEERKGKEDPIFRLVKKIESHYLVKIVAET